jgi:NAD(P)-dependent dehydrogenase (short-subunit alcohol dehydrogenase family)
VSAPLPATRQEAPGTPPYAGGLSAGRRALVTGATGFIGGRLAATLHADGWNVRCLVRDASRVATLRSRGCEIHEGEVLHPASLDRAGRDVEVACYPDMTSAARFSISSSGTSSTCVATLQRCPKGSSNSPTRSP